MDKRLFGLIIISITISVCACGPDKNSPEYITEQYLLAVKAKNWDVAKQYSDQSNIDAIDCLIRIGEERSDLTEVKDISCEINDNSATCTYCCTNFGNTGKGEEHLAKVNGEWKVMGLKETCPDQEPDYHKN